MFQLPHGREGRNPVEQINLTHAAFSEAIRDVQDAASRLHRDRDRIDDRVSGYLGSG